ncbi:hypothetical protein ACFE04_013971 [Oxalis oulophora]
MKQSKSFSTSRDPVASSSSCYGYDDVFAFSSLMEEVNKCQTPNTHLSDGLWFDAQCKDACFMKNYDVGGDFDELSLSQNLYRMSFQEEPKNRTSNMNVGCRGFGLELMNDSLDSRGVSSYYNGESGFNGSFEYGGIQDGIGETKPALFGFGMRDECHYKHDDLIKSCNICRNQFGGFCSDSTLCNSECHRPYGMEMLLQNQSLATCLNGNGLIIEPQQRKFDPSGNRCVNVNDIFGNGSVLKQRPRKPNFESLLSKNGMVDTIAFSCDHSYIRPEKGPRRNITYATPKQCIQNLDTCSPLTLPSSSSCLAAFRGQIYTMARDQYNCRFLQGVCDWGTSEDVEIIFNEIITHIGELMMDQFGNYLVLKLLSMCNEDQITQIVHMVTKEAGQLVKISLNSYGTGVVQKLIAVLRTRQQIVQVKLALQLGFLHLVEDLNGNNVINGCLQCFNPEDNKFIFAAATKFCLNIATHQHGCYVLQRCIGKAIGEDRDRLTAEVVLHGLQLAQNPYGNYVVQYIINLNIPSVNEKLCAKFKGHYIQLSIQKFSSHVVEKCLKNIPESHSCIIQEFLSVSRFDKLLQHQFANYVIQCALKVTKGQLHDVLAQAVLSRGALQKNPYRKRIYSRNLFKK